MDCQEVQALLDAYVDQELDIVYDMGIATHLQTCQTCTAQYQEMTALRAVLRAADPYFHPQAHMRQRVRSALRKSGRDAPWWPGQVALAALVLLALGIGGYGVWERFAGMPVERQSRDIVATHVRSLMVDHLTDIASTDQHEIKPWFTDKVSFSPSIVDLAPQGFQLIGARLEYIQEQPAAAVVYRRRQHIINVLMTRAAHHRDSRARPVTRHGYHLLHWTRAGMMYWLVSDLNQQELSDFAQVWQANNNVQVQPNEPAGKE